MGVKNVLQSCAITGGNTGVGSCFVDIGFIKGMIVVPYGKTYTTTTVAGLKTAIEADILADIPLQRAYPIGGFNNVEDGSEAPVFQTFADGSRSKVRDGFYNWTFQFSRGGLCLTIALRKWNGANVAFFLYDDKGKLFGVEAGTDLFKGITPDVFDAMPFTLNTGAASTVYRLNVSFTPDQMNENAAYVDFKSDGGVAYLSGLNGLQNVAINKVARAANVLTVQIFTACGTVDLNALYNTTLAAAGAWVAKNPAGALLTITSVSYSTNLNAYVITIDTTDPDYTAGQPITITLTGPTELAATPYFVKGYEGLPVVVTV